MKWFKGDKKHHWNVITKWQSLSLSPSQHFLISNIGRLTLVGQCPMKLRSSVSVSVSLNFVKIALLAFPYIVHDDS